MYETKKERLNRYNQSLAMLRLSHGQNATIDPEVDEILLEWVEKGGDFAKYQKRIDNFQKERYGVGIKK